MIGYVRILFNMIGYVRILFNMIGYVRILFNMIGYVRILFNVIRYVRILFNVIGYVRILFNMIGYVRILFNVIGYLLILAKVDIWPSECSIGPSTWQFQCLKIRLNMSKIIIPCIFCPPRSFFSISAHTASSCATLIGHLSIS